MGEAIRQACIQAALAAYEDAKLQGLCAEGAWECAVSAMQRLDVSRIPSIRVKRVYEPPEQSDGYRVLVDRVWPRGVTKDAAAIDRWLKSVAPSTKLRQWFKHDPDRWPRFRQAYRQELGQQEATLHQLLEDAGNQSITLVYSARDERHNNAVVLREYMVELAPWIGR